MEILSIPNPNLAGHIHPHPPSQPPALTCTHQHMGTHVGNSRCDAQPKEAQRHSLAPLRPPHMARSPLLGTPTTHPSQPPPPTCTHKHMGNLLGHSRCDVQPKEARRHSLAPLRTTHMARSPLLGTPPPPLDSPQDSHALINTWELMLETPAATRNPNRPDVTRSHHPRPPQPSICIAPTPHCLLAHEILV